MSPPAAPRVLLVGMMGAGKSSVGRELARRTGWPYVDNDELVRRATGKVAPEVAALSEPALRAAESAALTEALTEAAPLVAGVAGGVVLDPRDRDRLRRGGHVVWLRARLSTLVDRVGSGEGRAWLQPDPPAALARLAAAREPYYADVAGQVVDVDDVPPGEVADQILAALPPA